MRKITPDKTPPKKVWLVSRTVKLVHKGGYQTVYSVFKSARQARLASWSGEEKVAGPYFLKVLFFVSLVVSACGSEGQKPTSPVINPAQPTTQVEGSTESEPPALDIPQPTNPEPVATAPVEPEEPIAQEPVVAPDPTEPPAEAPEPELTCRAVSPRASNSLTCFRGEEQFPVDIEQVFATEKAQFCGKSWSCTVRLWGLTGVCATVRMANTFKSGTQTFTIHHDYTKCGEDLF